LGELGKLFIKKDELQVDYEVITVTNLRRSMTLNEIGLAVSPFWTLPSPNMPSWQSCVFFIPFVSLEGTNISEGRGTTIPFQVIGHPSLDVYGFIKYLHYLKSTNKSHHNNLHGILCKPHSFNPTFNKHHGNICKGLFFHYSLDASEDTNLFALGIYFLYYAMKSNWFAWKQPPYEYNYSVLPILLILGSTRWQEIFPEDRTMFRDNDAMVEHLLEWAYSEAQLFAKNTTFAHLYV